MKRTDGFHKTNSFQLPTKKYSAIQNYLRRINEIKNDNPFEPVSKRSHHYSHSNFLMSSTQMNLTCINQNVFQRSIAQKHAKIRSFSMKSQISPEYPTPSNKTKMNTVYNQKFNLTNVKIRENLFEQSDKKPNKNQTQMKSQLQKSLYDTKKSNQRVLTQPNDTFFSSFDSKTRLNTTFSQNKIERQDSIEKMQIAKNQIIQKIHLYVRNLDQNGEDELNQMLTNEYRKRIRFHSDAYQYETKIKQMITTNKQIVKLLKQELLTQRKIPNLSERVNLSQPYVLLANETLSHDKNIIINQLEANFQDKHKNESNFQSNSGVFERNESPDSKQGLHKSKPRNLQDQDVNNHEYQKEVQHVTKQFQSEWTKSQTHKKAIYQKFRSTIFQKYPEIRKRQRAIKGLTNNKIDPSSSQSDDQNSQAQVYSDGIKKLKNQLKKESSIKSFQLESKKNSVQIKNQVSPSKSNAYKSYSKTQAGEGKQNFQKTAKLSKKNSISKGSSRVLDHLSYQNKQEVAKINFVNLIDFIFKRAFFYSVSKNKVIQNKVPYGQMQYTPQVQKKDPNISFMLYNKSIKQKQYLKMEKLNEKKLRATGNYLIKNKYKIMGLEKEGNKSFDFLRKCLDDAVEDYLKGAKSK